MREKLLTAVAAALVPEQSVPAPAANDELTMSTPDATKRSIAQRYAGVVYTFAAKNRRAARDVPLRGFRYERGSGA